MLVRGSGEQLKWYKNSVNCYLSGLVLPLLCCLVCTGMYTYLLFKAWLHVPGARALTAQASKFEGGRVTWRTRLNGPTIPMQGPTLDAKLAAMGLNGLASSVRQLFVEASPTVEKAASCYKADPLVASLLSFHSAQSSLAIRKFRVAGEERCKRGHRRVCANLGCLMSCHSAELRTFGFTTQKFSIVGSYTENLEKPQNWGVGACTGQYGYMCSITLCCDHSFVSFATTLQ